MVVTIRSEFRAGNKGSALGHFHALRAELDSHILAMTLSFLPVTTLEVGTVCSHLIVQLTAFKGHTPNSGRARIQRARRHSLYIFLS